MVGTDRPCLLVVDNCEHLLGGVVGLVSRLLTACPGLVVLATSRARLHVGVRWGLRRAGLSVAAVSERGGDAVELFEARAAAAGAVLGGDARSRIPSICTSLTAAPWRSSLPRPACRPSDWTDWRPASPNRCACWVAVSPRTIGTGRCVRRWIGLRVALPITAGLVAPRVDFRRAVHCGCGARRLGGLAAGRRERAAFRAGRLGRSEPAHSHRRCRRDPLSIARDDPPIRHGIAGVARGAGAGVEPASGVGNRGGSEPGRRGRAGDPGLAVRVRSQC